MFKEALASFVKKNLALRYTYIELVSTLPLFTLTERDGLWNLLLSLFQIMLSDFHQYNHNNYRIYVNKLPPP